MGEFALTSSPWVSSPSPHHLITKFSQTTSWVSSQTTSWVSHQWSLSCLMLRSVPICCCTFSHCLVLYFCAPDDSSSSSTSSHRRNCLFPASSSSTLVYSAFWASEELAPCGIGKGLADLAECHTGVLLDGSWCASPCRRPCRPCRRPCRSPGHAAGVS
jgi:hypothetical protein